MSKRPLEEETTIEMPVPAMKMVKLRFDKILTGEEEDFMVPSQHKIIQNQIHQQKHHFQQQQQQHQPPAKSLSSKGPVTKIYANTVNGRNFFDCPFCEVVNFVSGIRFRKHLKQYHPGRDTFIVNTPKESLVSTVDIESVLRPTMILPKSPAIQTTQPTTQFVQESITVQTVNTDIIGFNRLETDFVATSKPVHSNDITLFKPGNRFNKENDVLKEVDNEMEDYGVLVTESLVSDTTVDYEKQTKTALLISDKKEYLAPTELPESDICCCICSGSLDIDKISSFSDARSIEIHGEFLLDIICDVVADKISNSVICSGCEGVASEVARTRASLLELQKRLEAAVSRLKDLYQVGHELQDKDLAAGGFLDPSVCVRVVEAGGLVSREANDMGLIVTTNYLGRIITGNGDEVVEDDGSCPEVVDSPEDDVAHLYISQQEWASGGLLVSGGVVQVPRNLATGILLGAGRPRTVLSEALSQDLGEEPYVCLDCDTSWPSVAKLADHCSTHKPLNDPTPPAGGLSNPVGGGEAEGGATEGPEVSQYNSGEQYKADLRQFMHREQFKDCANDTPTLDQPFQCSECNKCFSRAQELWGHQSSFSGPSFTCNYQNCKESFTKLGQFAQHYVGHAGHQLEIPESSQGKKELKITCPVCGIVISGLYKLQRHKSRHDPELKYKCPACEKQFVKANTLRMHISNVHVGNREHKECNLCGKLISSDSGMYNHMKSAHNASEREHVCNLCGAGFSLPAKLKEHMLKHKDPESWEHACDQCGRQFHKKAALVAHLQRKEKSGSCYGPVKGRGRRNPPLGTTTKVGRMSCPECDQLVEEGDTLQEHFKAGHNDEEARYQCSECEQRMLSLEGCRRHYRQAHRGRPHTCWICKETFTRDTALHFHLGEAHQDVVGEAPGEGDTAPCKYCSQECVSQEERISHTRHTHMVESIDITGTDLEEVTMVGGHVVEFGAGGEQIVALHTIP